MTKPIVHDGRTDAEKRYDAERSGAAYTKPAASQDDMLISLLDDMYGTERDGDGPATLQIERHTHHTDGSPAGDPWTTYTFGEAGIDIQDAGGGNLIIPGHCIDFQDHAPLFDLHMLLSNATVRAALDREEDANPDEGPWGPILDIIVDRKNDGKPHADPEPLLPADASPLLKSLIDWAKAHIDAERAAGATPEEEFEAGVVAGLALGKAIQEDEKVTITHQESWDEFTAGCVEITHDYSKGISTDGPFNLYIHGEQLELPITYELLRSIMTSLAYLLSNDRVLATFGQPAA